MPVVHKRRHYTVPVTTEPAGGLSFAERRAGYAGLIADFVRRVPPVHLLSDVAGDACEGLAERGGQALLESQGVDYEAVRFAPGQWHQPDSGRMGTLVVPGGTDWVARRSQNLPEFVLQASGLYERVVVLPSTYDIGLDTVRIALEQPNVFPFAREPRSYHRMKSLYPVVLAFDPALYALGTDRWRPEVAAPAQPGADVRVVLRKDPSSPFEQTPWRPNPDLNEEICGVCDVDSLLSRIRRAAEVVTDQLPVVVGALLSGVPVRYLDNSESQIAEYLSYVWRSEPISASPCDTAWLAACNYIVPKEA